MVIALMARSSSRALRKPTNPTSTGSENSVDQGPVAGSIVHVETGGPVRPNCSESGSAPGPLAVDEPHVGAVAARRQREAAVVHDAQRLRLGTQSRARPSA